MSHAAFPDPYDIPTLTPEQSGCALVSRPIPSELLTPESSMRLGLSIAARTTMPEAAVDKECHLGAWPGKVWGSD